MSGIADNFKKIKEFGKYKNRERELEREVVQASIEDSNFYDNYSSFIDGLQKKLDYILDDQGYQVVFFKPNGVSNAKYFRAIMDDDQFTTNYNIDKTVGGEFSFELKTL